MLSVVPVLMVGFAGGAIVLAGDHALLVQVQSEIVAQVPGALSEPVNKLVEDAVEARGTVGAFGLVIASTPGWAG